MLNWVDTFLYYSPYLFQFVFLIGFYYKDRVYEDIFYAYDSYTFLLFGIAFLVLVYFSKFSFYYYTNTLIIYYIIQTLIYYVFLKVNRFNIKDSVCLAFIASFASSFYWELPIHIMDLVNGLFLLNSVVIVNVIMNSMHFATLPFLKSKLEIINRKSFYQYLLYGLIFSNVIALINFYSLTNFGYMPYSVYLNMISRIFCGVMIIKGVLTNVRRKTNNPYSRQIN